MKIIAYVVLVHSTVNHSNCKTFFEENLGSCAETGSTCNGGSSTATSTGRNSLDGPSCARFCAREQASGNDRGQYAYYSFDGETCECYDECEVRPESGCSDCVAGLVGCVARKLQILVKLIIFYILSFIAFKRVNQSQLFMAAN